MSNQASITVDVHRLLASADGRHCNRCLAETHGKEPHLCADLKVRYERQAKAVAIVKSVLDKGIRSRVLGLRFSDADIDAMAETIVTKLAGRDLGV